MDICQIVVWHIWYIWSLVLSRESVLFKNVMASSLVHATPFHKALSIIWLHSMCLQWLEVWPFRPLWVVKQQQQQQKQQQQKQQQQQIRSESYLH